MVLSFGFLFLAAVFNTASSTCLKYTSLVHGRLRATVVLIIVGLTLAGVNTLFYTKSLQKVQMGIAYPILAGLSMVLMTFVGSRFFGEMLSVSKMMGICAVGAGIFLLSRS